ncbi:MAG: PhzF family phenazine biosynthesis protein [Planctomycetaceae bacterium]|nr:PhzF family phenazine biosynthesis protein [Planctomycetaceae bacterium]
MTTIPCFQVDAFTAEPFRGNPAAVCLLDEPADERWMQSVAAEMNLAETAFVRPLDEETFELRWFTPRLEVDLCGHATLAAAHVLWEQSQLPADRAAQFQTRSGTLVCEKQGDLIQMDFPATPAHETTRPPGLEAALGVQPLWVGQSRYDYLVGVIDEEEVQSARPDFRALAEIETRGVIVTSISDDDRYDFVSRFFAPRAGVDEDPVTGSAHCCLAPYWSDLLSKEKLIGYQASERGGVVHTECVGDRVKLKGPAVTVLCGEIVV